MGGQQRKKLSEGFLIMQQQNVYGAGRFGAENAVFSEVKCENRGRSECPIFANFSLSLLVVTSIPGETARQILNKRGENRELTEHPCETGRIDVTGSEIRFRATVDRLTLENPENSVALGGNRK